MEKDTIAPESLKTKSLQDLYNDLQAPQDGLTSEEASARLEKFGRNEIVEKKTRPLLKFLKSFWGPIPWMIEIAAVLSAIIRHWEDFWIIITLLLINAVVSFLQENKADNAIEMLKKKLALNARVLRDKVWKKLPASELVPGDIIRVRLGDVVPADIKLVSGDYLNADESALTGESLPVEKKEGDIAYSGSVIRMGEMNGLVVETGMNTFFGRTAKLVDSAKTQSHFQKAVVKIGNYLILMALVLVFLIIMVGFFRHEPFMEMFQFALVLMVAAIPAALPAVLSVTMAVGATALAKKEAIVSKLASIEELAGMDILCSDKTGTITKNELTVADVIPFGEFTDKQVLFYASLASNADNQDPIDSAILDKASKVAEMKNNLSEYTLDQFKPFDPVSKRTEAIVHNKEHDILKVAKGAPQVILSLVGKNAKLEEKMDSCVLEFAEKGYRALGVALSDTGNSWQYVGLIPMYDPPREDSAETIRQAQKMGVEVKMVTGDHEAIAKQIAEEIGMGKEIVPAEKLTKLNDRKAIRLIEKVNGFAQVFPEHKYEIVELMQEKGHIVGMTGDGVNDAPALKKADAGIAVQGSTDAAKSAAAIVLTKPGLSVILDAIKQSRKIFQRMGNYSIYRIAETIRVLLFITVSIITFQFYPVTALMIVMLALLNDAPIMTIAFDNVRVSSSPDRWNMRSTLSISTILGIIGVFSSFGIFFIGKEIFHLSNDLLQSFIYLKLSVAGHLTVFVARTRGHFWSVKPSKSLLYAVIVTQLVATIIVISGFLLPAISWKLALFVWAYSLVAFVLTDFLKVKAYQVLNHSTLKFKN
jgi:H+-transporting ATPase